MEQSSAKIEIPWSTSLLHRLLGAVITLHQTCVQLLSHSHCKPANCANKYKAHFQPWRALTNTDWYKGVRGEKIWKLKKQLNLENAHFPVSGCMATHKNMFRNSTKHTERSKIHPGTATCHKMNNGTTKTQLTARQRLAKYITSFHLSLMLPQ